MKFCWQRALHLKDINAKYICTNSPNFPCLLLLPQGSDRCAGSRLAGRWADRKDVQRVEGGRSIGDPWCVSQRRGLSSTNMFSRLYTFLGKAEIPSITPRNHREAPGPNCKPWKTNYITSCESPNKTQVIFLLLLLSKGSCCFMQSVSQSLV